MSFLLFQRKKFKSKEKDDKVNGAATLDPYASDDEDHMRQIARSFESKYVSWGILTINIKQYISITLVFAVFAIMS